MTDPMAKRSFRILMETDSELIELRRQYARSPRKRRRAASFELDRAQAESLFGAARGHGDTAAAERRGVILALAIDPDYPAAILAVGSLEHQFGRPAEAMALFRRLTELPPDAEDLLAVVDRAGDFLIDRGDLPAAASLYGEAVRAFPGVAEFHVGLGYCTSRSGSLPEAVAHHRRAVELDPDHPRHLNDLGYSLLEAGEFDEAEAVLRRAVERSEPGDDLARNNLEHLRRLRRGRGR